MPALIFLLGWSGLASLASLYPAHQVSYRVCSLSFGLCGNPNLLLATVGFLATVGLLVTIRRYTTQAQ